MKIFLMRIISAVLTSGRLAPTINSKSAICLSIPVLNAVLALCSHITGARPDAVEPAATENNSVRQR